MFKGQEIQAAIESLPRNEYATLREWFLERDWAEWDKQIEADSAAGRLDFLIEESRFMPAKGAIHDIVKTALIKDGWKITRLD